MKQALPTFDAVKRYLIQDLSDEERENIESLFADEEAFNEFRYWEDHLIDEYLRNRLDVTDRQLFESNYLNFSMRRRKKVEFARSLLDKAYEIRAKGSLPATTGVDSARRRRPLLQPIFATLVLLLFPGLIYLSYLTNKQQKRVEYLTERLKLAEERQAELQRKQDELRLRYENTEQRIEGLSVDSPVGPSLPSPTDLQSLVNAVARGDKGGSKIPVSTVPASSKVLRIKFDVPDERQYVSYVAKLQTVHGAEIKNFDLKAAAGKSKVLTISSNLLKNATYVIKLYGVDPSIDTQPIPLDSFFFTLRKK